MIDDDKLGYKDDDEPYRERGVGPNNIQTVLL
jgi:hypothetical protein